MPRAAAAGRSTTTFVACELKSTHFARNTTPRYRGIPPDIGVCPDFGLYPKSAYTPISAYTPMNKDDGCTHSTNCSSRPKLRSGSKLPRRAPKVATGGARSHVPGSEAARPGALELVVGAHHAAGLGTAARGVPQGRRHVWQATH